MTSFKPNLFTERISGDDADACRPHCVAPSSQILLSRCETSPARRTSVKRKSIQIGRKSSFDVGPEMTMRQAAKLAACGTFLFLFFAVFSPLICFVAEVWSGGGPVLFTYPRHLESSVGALLVGSEQTWCQSRWQIHNLCSNELWSFDGLLPISFGVFLAASSDLSSSTRYNSRKEVTLPYVCNV